VLPIEPFASCDFYFLIEARVAVGAGLLDLNHLIHVTQVDRNHYLCFGEPGVLINHACEGNATLVALADGGYGYRALRDIAEGEELTWDYSTVISDYHVMRCLGCGPRCRGFASRPSFMCESERRRMRERHPPEWLLPHMVAELEASFSGIGLEPMLLPYGWDGEGPYAEFVAGNPHFDERFRALVSSLPGTA
jgi:hypothetical protein